MVSTFDQGADEDHVSTYASYSLLCRISHYPRFPACLRLSLEKGNELVVSRQGGAMLPKLALARDGLSQIITHL